MNFWQFTFFFLYVRNWHTGQLELSRPRITLFMIGIFLLVFGFTLVSFMQTPVRYTSPDIPAGAQSHPVIGSRPR